MIDESGVLGQVTRVYPLVSEVTLLIDRDMAIPVLNVRTGVRSVAYGQPSTKGDGLELRYTLASADIAEGDLLTTSGVDGVYPPGLPVARVTLVERQAESSFSRIEAEPLAQVQGALHVLVLTPGRCCAAAPAPDRIRPRTRCGRPARHPEQRAMIMRPGQQLLLPANPAFIWFSLLAALHVQHAAEHGPVGPRGLGARPAGGGAGVLERAPAAAHRRGRGVRVSAWPWTCTRAPCWASMRWPTPCSDFLAISMHRRLLWFGVPNQAVQVLPLFVAAHLLELLVRMASGGSFPGLAYFLAPVLEAALWPVVSVLLLAPQRRAPNPDDNRPL